MKPTRKQVQKKINSTKYQMKKTLKKVKERYEQKILKLEDTRVRE